jgi:hypothetical protein
MIDRTWGFRLPSLADHGNPTSASLVVASLRLDESPAGAWGAAVSQVSLPATAAPLSGPEVERWNPPAPALL